MRTQGGYDHKFELGLDFVQCSRCTYPQVSSFYVYSFRSYRVGKQTNKQTPLKTSNSVRYATTSGNDSISRVINTASTNVKFLLFSQIAVHLLALLVTWLVAGHVTAAALPTNASRHHRHRHHGDRVRSRHTPASSVDTPEVPPVASERVVFASRPPTTPPWFVDRSVSTALVELLSYATAHEYNRTTSVQRSYSDEIRRSGRQRRSVPSRQLPSHPALLQPVCDSASEWLQLFEAEDVFGNRVRVLQEIDNGSSRVNQYFYETRCTSTNRRNGLPPACSGIDSASYESVCYESHVWAYAKVADYSRAGDGWTLVKIRASCNCGLVLRSTLRRGRRLGMLHDIAG